MKLQTSSWKETLIRQTHWTYTKLKILAKSEKGRDSVYRIVGLTTIVAALLAASGALQIQSAVESSTTNVTETGTASGSYSGTNSPSDTSGLSTSSLITSTRASQAYTYTSNYGQSYAPPSNPIKHIIVIMQENHSFDNYFGTFPGVIGIPPGLCMTQNPNETDSGCVGPYLATDPVLQTDLPHMLGSYAYQYDNGKMDGFVYSATGKGYDANEAMSYFNGQTLPVIWSYAEHYTLADMFFGSVRSYSQPNHWYMMAGTSPEVSIYEAAPTEQASCVNSSHQVTLSTCTYIKESQNIQTIVDLLSNSGLTWKYYDSPLGSTTLDKAIISGNALNYWNPLEAKNTSYILPTYANNFVWRGQILDDIGNGDLPQVSWVIPAGSISDHPPANVTLGEYWIGDVVNSVMNSQYWKNTAIILTWDEPGGFFDTIAPPNYAQHGLGFRVPAIIISPYAKAGYIDNTIMDFDSTLRFIEWTFDLPSLGTQDAISNNLLSAFNFNQTPLPPDPYPLTTQDLATIQPCLFSNNNCTANIKIDGSINQLSYSPNGTSDAFLQDDDD